LGGQNCVHCGKETEEGELYCPDCQAISGAKKPRRFWIFSILFSGLLLFFTGLLLWHGGLSFGSLSLDSILGRPAAVINGEPIARTDLKARVKSVRAMLERQYGRDLFAGQQGRELLENLEQEVLDGMLEERLVSQEARRLRIQISDEMVQQELQKISKEIYGTWENFQARLREDGVSKEDLQNHIRSLLLYKAVKAAKAPPGSNPDVSFNAWLIQAKQKAELAIYYSGDNAASSSALTGGCCSPGGSGIVRPGGPVDPKTESDAKKVALEAYQKANPAGKGVTAKVTNYGCHIQVDIQKEGRIVKSYTYQGGKAFEIS
jgi:predicted nucleic acid-binding Zn ribbon protein